MSWLRRALGSSRPSSARRGPEHHDASAPVDGEGLEGDDDVFACSTCGRTDLPEAGDWDPPICLECDAEINFAAIEEVEITGGW